MATVDELIPDGSCWNVTDMPSTYQRHGNQLRLISDWGTRIASVDLEWLKEQIQAARAIRVDNPEKP